MLDEIQNPDENYVRHVMADAFTATAFASRREREEIMLSLICAKETRQTFHQPTRLFPPSWAGYRGDTVDEKRREYKQPRPADRARKPSPRTASVAACLFSNFLGARLSTHDPAFQIATMPSRSCTKDFSNDSIGCGSSCSILCWSLAMNSRPCFCVAE